MIRTDDLIKSVGKSHRRHFSKSPTIRSTYSLHTLNPKTLNSSLTGPSYNPFLSALPMPSHEPRAPTRTNLQLDIIVSFLTLTVNPTHLTFMGTSISSHYQPNPPTSVKPRTTRPASEAPKLMLRARRYSSWGFSLNPCSRWGSYVLEVRASVRLLAKPDLS